MKSTTIKGLADAGGVGVETIRYYQRRGLLDTPERSGGGGIGTGIRRYDNSDVKRLRFIRSAQLAGFTLNEIAELLALDATNDRARAHALAKKRIEGLDIKIRELRKARQALENLAKECSSTSDGPCPIIASFIV